MSLTSKSTAIEELIEPMTLLTASRRQPETSRLQCFVVKQREAVHSHVQRPSTAPPSSPEPGSSTPSRSQRKIGDIEVVVDERGATRHCLLVLFIGIEGSIVLQYPGVVKGGRPGSGWQYGRPMMDPRPHACRCGERSPTCSFAYSVEGAHARHARR